MTQSIIGRWPRAKSYLDRCIDFCFSRADLALDEVHSRLWIKRGNIFAKVRAGWYND